MKLIPRIPPNQHTSCAGKVAFPNPAAANAQLRRFIERARYQRKSHRMGRCETWKLSFYSCPFCGAWHVGNLPRRLRS